MGETPQRLAKDASLPNLWGLSPATINSVAALCRCRCLPKRPELRGGLRHQPLGVRLQLCDLLREGLVAAGHRTQREPGCRWHVARAVSEAEACGRRGELLRGEPAQTVKEFVRCRNAQAL
jgi:hypothetical protein